MLGTATGGGVGRTKTMHVAPHVSQVIAPRLHMAWGRRGGRGHGTRGGQKCQNDQKSERVTDGFLSIFGIAM